MTRLTLLLIALLGLPVIATAQDAALHEGAVIASIDVSGVSRDQLSAGLRRDLDALTGERLTRERVTALAARIEAEHPDSVAAVRDVLLPDGRVRVLFLAAKISDDPEMADNINARYTVERAEVSGIDQSRLDQRFRDAMQALVGQRLDPEAADRLAGEMETAFPDYDVSRTVRRGDEPGHIRVVFHFRRTEASRWIHFQGQPSQIVYHHDQGWSGAINLVFDSDHTAFTLGLVRGNNDDLVEEYSGYSLRLQHREPGTRRLGIDFGFSKYSQEWKEATLTALAAEAGATPLYRSRRTIRPAVTFAVTRALSVTGGMLATELTPSNQLEPLGVPAATGSPRVNAGLFEVRFHRDWTPGRTDGRLREAGDDDARQSIHATYAVHAGSSALSSDAIYKRHAASVQYRYHRDDHTVDARAHVGGISGVAPLFERFTLGDTSTLRGWNKYDIAPAGASRVAYGSFEYVFNGFAYFVDAGSLWSAGEDRKVRVSTGVGFRSDHGFVTVGVPLNGGKLSGTFMLGVRF